MENIARKIQETQTKLDKHLSYQGSFLAGENWKKEKHQLEDALHDLKVKFYDSQIHELENKKARWIRHYNELTKNRKEVKSA